MFLSTVLDNVWLAVGLWVALFLLDHLLTLKAARMYEMGANKHFTFSGGYELNPYFKEDIARLRTFSFRFFADADLRRRSPDDKSSAAGDVRIGVRNVDRNSTGCPTSAYQ